MNALRLLALLAVAVPGVAMADIAPPPVESMQCPRGAVGALPEVDSEARDPMGRPVRPWPYCAPSTCRSNDDCSGGRVCSDEPISLCVEDHEQSGATVRRVRTRGCEPDGTCLNVHSECEVARRCVTPSEATSDTESATDEDEAPETEPSEAPEALGTETGGSCACRATPAGALAPWPFLAGLGLLALRRR